MRVKSFRKKKNNKKVWNCPNDLIYITTSRGGSATAATPKMELFVTIINSFWLLTIFVKLSILDVYGIPRCSGYARICWWYATKISILGVFSNPRSAYVMDTMIPFLKWLFSIQSSCLGYYSIGLHFQNTQTQGNLVKELHLGGYSSPRFRAFQICMRWRSKEDFYFKSLKKRQTCWGLNFAYYRFPFSNVRNLLCCLMCTYFLSQVKFLEYVFSPSIQSASKGTSSDTPD